MQSTLQLCTLLYMHMYRSVHSNEEKQSSAARSITFRAALYVGSIP